MSIRAKAALLIVALAACPVVAALALLLPGYGVAVEASARRYQMIALSEIAAAVRAPIERRRAAAAQVADAIARVVAEDRGLAPIVNVIADTTAIDAARFEVPGAGVDTVLGKPQRDEPPRSTEALRARADARGQAIGVAGESQAALVVPVRTAAGASKGYVTVAVPLADLAEEVAVATRARLLDDPDTHVLVADADRGLLAAQGQGAAESAASAELSGLWEAARPGVVSFGVEADVTIGATPSLGTAHVLNEEGLTLLMWRPRRVALADYHRVRSLVFYVGGGAVLLALVVGALASGRVTAPVLELATRVERIGRRDWDSLPPPMQRGDELGVLDRAIHRMADDLKSSEAEVVEQARLRSDLSRFMSKDLVDAIVSGEHDLVLGGERREITVLFADIVAFTPLAEREPPEVVVALLNELFTVVTEVVFRHEGVVDKFIGDCVMAVWGAPRSAKDHAVRALAAAEDIMTFLESGAKAWRSKYGVEVRLCIGVNSGEAIVGNIGSDKRMEYTVVGDVVNVAARLEAIAAPNQVLVAEGTQRLVGDAFPLRLLGAQKLSGREVEMQVYELEME